MAWERSFLPLTLRAPDVRVALTTRPFLGKALKLFPTQGGYSVRGCLMFWALSSSSCLYIYISLSLSLSLCRSLSLSFSVSLSLSLSLSCCYVFPLDLGSIDAASLPILVLRSGPRIACSVCPSLYSLSIRRPWRTTCTGCGCNSRAMYLSSGQVLVAEVGVEPR